MAREFITWKEWVGKESMSKEKKNYIFEISIGDEYASHGQMTVQAESTEKAEEIMMEIVGNRLYDAFPILDIPYYVHLYGCNGMDCIECEKQRHKMWEECMYE